MNHKALLASVLFATLAAVGCGESSSSSASNANGGGTGGGSGGGSGGSSNSELGSVEFTASGAVTGEFSGMMDFHYMDFDDFGVQGASWELSGHDGVGGSQSFSLTISVESFSNGGEGIGRPEVGTYDVGFVANSTEVFSAIFVHIGDGGVMDSTEYATDTNTYTGTLVITESTNDRVSGTFVIDLYWEDYCLAGGCVGDSVNLTGEFTAYDRLF